MTNNRVNLTERHEAGGWAVYLPAISGFYTIQMGKMDVDPAYIGRPMPAGLEHGHVGLDFLNKDKGYFHYRWGLFSAGHAQLNLDKANDTDPLVQRRDRKNTMILGDSGGFQIATGVLKLDWATVKGTGGDALREQILRWLEHTADWSMTLDVPAFAADRFSHRTGLTKFEDTLDITVHNLNYFMEHRIPGKTKFLNVLSGSTAENSKQWFDTVIPYSIPACVESMGYSVDKTLEGYAFAGFNMSHMPTVLNRILDLRELDALHDKDWIHFLGIGRLDWACYLTSIMRQLRKYDNPNITISFDAASPFVATAYGLAYTYNTFEPTRLTYSMSKGIDDKRLKNSKLGMPWQSPIMDRLTAGDFCAYGVGDKNKMNKEGKTSWDSFTYALYMAHNVYNHIQAVQEVNRLADLDYITKPVPLMDIKNQKTDPKFTGPSQHIPYDILCFDTLVAEILNPENPNPRETIKKYSTFLQSISFGSSHKKSHINSLNTLWDLSADTVVGDQDKMADSRDFDTDEKLTELDKMIKDE